MAPIRKSISIIFAMCFVAILGVLAWHIARQGEPVYQGKTLSRWLEDVGDNSEYYAAEQAVKHTGTNVVPVIRRMILRRDGPLKLKLLDLAQKQEFIPFHLRTARKSHEQAAMACRMAEPVVRALLVNDWIRLIERGDYDALSLADSAESQTGPEASEPLMRALTNGNPRVVAFAMSALVGIPAGSKTIVPALLEKLNDASPEVRSTAAWSLGDLRQEPQTVIPAILRGLEDQCAQVRLESIAALERFTNHPSSTVPALLKALHGDKEEIVQLRAFIALEKIAPEATASEAMDILRGSNNPSSYLRFHATEALDRLRK
jgi:hypothetical protein